MTRHGKCQFRIDTLWSSMAIICNNYTFIVIISCGWTYSERTFTRVKYIQLVTVDKRLLTVTDHLHSILSSALRKIYWAKVRGHACKLTLYLLYLIKSNIELKSGFAVTTVLCILNYPVQVVIDFGEDRKWIVVMIAGGAHHWIRLH